MSDTRFENLLFLLGAASLPAGCAVGTDVFESGFPATSGVADEGDDEDEAEESDSEAEDSGSTDASASSQSGPSTDPATDTTAGETTLPDPTTTTDTPTTTPVTIDPTTASTSSSSTYGGSTFGPATTGSDATCYDYGYLVSVCYYGGAQYYYYFEDICEYYQALALSYGAACYAAFQEFLSCLAALDCAGLAMVGVGSSCDDEQQSYFNAC